MQAAVRLASMQVECDAKLEALAGREAAVGKGEEQVHLWE